MALRPEADPADLDEYERLLAERFAVDPDQAPPPQPEALMEERESAENRLAELYEKLFGPGTGETMSHQPINPAEK